MKVTIMYRNSYVGGDGWTFYPMQVEIADTCPVCGGPRGTPFGHNFIEDGDAFHVHRWNNPCGHVDKYKDVYHEHLRRVEIADNPSPRKPKAWVGKNENGSFHVRFEDVEDGSRMIGQYKTVERAKSFAEMNGYEVVDPQLQDRCGCRHG